jgi:hypothetical protein
MEYLSWFIDGLHAGRQVFDFRQGQEIFFYSAHRPDLLWSPLRIFISNKAIGAKSGGAKPPFLYVYMIKVVTIQDLSSARSYIEHEVSETGFYLRLQVNLLSWSQYIELAVSETSVILIYHRHKPIDSINLLGS